jgi:hypothetical protein
MNDLFNTSKDILEKISIIAYDGRKNIELDYKPLSTAGKVELFMFNSIYCWWYIQDNSLLMMTSENADCFTNISSKFAQQIVISITKSIYFQLLKERFSLYKAEYKKVVDNQLTNQEYFPNYFFSRLYKYPLSEFDINEKYINDDFEKDLLTDIFKHHVVYLDRKLNEHF